MSQKIDGSASLWDEEMKKKVKLDESSSNGSASAIGTPTHEDSLKPLILESSASFPGEETKKKMRKKTGSSSANCSSIDQSSIKMNKRTFLYKKSLTHDDVTKFKIKIPLESGKKFLAEPEKIDGKYRSITMLIMDHDGQIWPMEVTFEELSSSYVLWLNWDNYFKAYGLEAGDVIFLYFDPAVASFGHFLIEYEKKGAIDPPASAIAGNQSNLRPLMEKKPRS